MDQLNKENVGEILPGSIATSPRPLHMSLEGGLNDNDLLAIGKSEDGKFHLRRSVLRQLKIANNYIISMKKN